MAKAIQFDTSKFVARSKLLKSIIKKKTVNALDALGAFGASESKFRAPIDEGFLTADIETETYPNDSIAVIRVPVNATSSEYAIKMHEDNYNLGPNSIGKQAQTGQTVGRKFITRALDEEKDTMKKIIKKELAL